MFPAIIERISMSDTNTPPVCIGIILDGNRRWAKEQGVPSSEGHRRGAENIEPIVRAAQSKGVRHLIVYAFSTENWNRSGEEVSYLMELFESAARERLTKLSEEGVALRFVGQTDRFSASLQKAMREAQEQSPAHPSITLWVCISYGGRAEIVHAAAELSRTNQEITEESLAAALWTAGMPDPDLIIRTGGVQRLSNFLPWQSVYSELFFLTTYWPDFTKEDLERVLDEYAVRERRIGT
jgi:undecaprenyl diphosphate synthase